MQSRPKDRPPARPRQPIRVLRPGPGRETGPATAEAPDAMAPAAGVPPAVRIDEGFRELMPPPSAEELIQLEANIVSEGCRDPLVCWNGILLDGHNRYRICVKHGIEFRVVSLDLPSRSAAEEWIVRGQFGRRNLQPIHRIELATRLEAIYAERARENLKTYSRRDSEGQDEPPGVPLLKSTKALDDPGGAPGDVPGVPLLISTKALETPTGDVPGVPLLISTKALDTPADAPDDPLGVPLLISTKALDPPVPIHARRRAAKAAGVSESTYREGKVVLEAAPPELKEKVRRGEVSIHTAYRQVVPKLPAGRCRLNGELVPDPPDIARARRAGKIGPDVVPDIQDPGDGDDVVTFADDGGDEPAAGTDAEWLATLPVWHQLGPGARVRFEVDALAYRACEEARGRFAHSVRSVLASASRRGSLPTFLHRTRSYLKINHPRHWTLCPPPEHGGCGGTGILDITGTCTRCFGGGYLI